MAKKKTSKPVAAESAATEPKPPAPSLPVLGTPPPASVFPDPASLLPQFQSSATMSPTAPAAAPVTPARARLPLPPRRFNPTFDAPPREVREARQQAELLRQTLGNAARALEIAVRQVGLAKAYLAANPAGAEQFALLDISLADAEAFAREAEDVLNLFKPVEPAQG